jgi:hypothetical protein
MIAEYLEKAIAFEQMAGSETNPELKGALLNQADAYRKLAAERATRLNLALPPNPSKSG